jgi:LmbE family N-acetylglucosaminyl deacetylase
MFAAFPRGLFLPQYDLCIGMMGDPPVPERQAIGAAPWDVEVDIRGVKGAKLAAVAAHRTQLPGGDPFELFPPGVLEGCMPTERYTLAQGSQLPQALLAAMAGNAT